MAAAAGSRRADATAVRPVTSVRTLEADGIRVFYREAGPPDGAVVLLLHGFPASSFMFRYGVSILAVVAPEGHTLDVALLARPGNMDIQLDLLLDYANNVRRYPAFQNHFRQVQPPLLAIWGKHDPFFVTAGAEAFRNDLPNAHVQFLDTGHFATGTHVVDIAAAMRAFLDANGLSPVRSE